MDPNSFGQPGSHLSQPREIVSGKLQAVGGLMVMDMSSPGLLHSWSSSRFLDEVSPFLHQVSTDVSRYLNVPSLNCGSNLTKGLNNLSDSNKLVHSSPYLGILTIDGPVNGTGYSRKYGGKDHISLCGQRGQGESNQKSTNKAVDEFVYVGCGCDPLADFLYVPRNHTLVKIDGNLIIESVLTSEKPWNLMEVDPREIGDADGDVIGSIRNFREKDEV
ncbi:hypothetical protein MTR67_019438 [Solanum verrucosum]|uniref:Uncharacterized protein n=1 Tax=Solanum verrucosum TaxID=315347 RepID=A0AAF0QMX4_SOLVR|nr:hypothetical protein MTR67_019438 [Solanum verrucosum]